jgi:indolepyruvate ferredoxin oxidoreductase
VQEYVELGLHGWAMSRFSGCFVGFKALADTVESSTSIEADPFATQILLPADFTMPSGGLNARLSADTVGGTARAYEALMQDFRIYAALAYARANKLNRVTLDSPNPRLGIAASGKSYLDVLEALKELGIDASSAGRVGIRLLKISMPWPLEPDSVREFATGLEEILVVEEKRQVVEYQLKEQLYNWREDVRPRVVGKFDDQGEWVHPRGEWLLPATADLSVAQIARVIAQRIARFHRSEAIESRLALLTEKQSVLDRAVATPTRPAFYCSGCPHNTSTRTPEGSVALAGIGCHVMATSIFPESNRTTTHMGGEGATWIGQAPFLETRHVFANLGDGTYFHSGSLAIRASIAARVNITYKILYNDAVAMTGGQPIDGRLRVEDVIRQLWAEGVQRIALVSEEPRLHLRRNDWPQGVTVHDRDELDAVQQELTTVQGVSALVYDQTCAAEKRRRRKRRELADPPRRLYINEAVCEGCGDCGVQSNCTSILPVETTLGRKRQIDQSSCNKDYSCVKGFCPSFVTVLDAEPRKQARSSPNPAPAQAVHLPAVQVPSIEDTYDIYIAGIGGTGVITIGALLGMAAHLEGKGVSVLDMTGMSQKNGTVVSHVRLARMPGATHSQRIPTGEADLLLGCDLLAAGSADAIAKTHPGRTRAIVNLHEQPIGAFTRDRDWTMPVNEIRQLISDSVGGRCDFIDATKLATALIGDAIATNLFMLGFAYQRGLVPISLFAIERAIQLNGVAVQSSMSSFGWGRAAAADLQAVRRMALPEVPISFHAPEPLGKLI